VAETAFADIQVKKSKNEFLGVCEPKKILLRDFAEEYLEYSKANKAESSYDRDVTTIRKHLLAEWSDLYLHRITVREIEAYKTTRLQKVTPATVNRELALISNMFRKAVEWGHLNDTPMTGVRKLRTGRPFFRYLTGDEAERLVEACRESPNPQLYAFVVTALNTGMRLGELTALEWKDVDFKRGAIRVDNKKDHHTKNYEPRIIPMNQRLSETLKMHPRRVGSSYVFANSRGDKFHKLRTSFENAV
jgi:integrase